MSQKQFQEILPVSPAGIQGPVFQEPSGSWTCVSGHAHTHTYTHTHTRIHICIVFKIEVLLYFIEAKMIYCTAKENTTIIM